MPLEIMSQQTFDLKPFRSTQSISLPKGWDYGEYTQGRFSHCQQFHPGSDLQTTIIVSCRGFDLEDAMAKKLQQVLTAEPHPLHDLERKRIAEVFDHQAVRTRFTMTSARTEVWQNKTVLVTEGTYTGSGEQSFTLFIDVAGDGKWVEEFQYSAPGERFGRHFNDVMAAFKNLKWSDSSPA
jgi:hypothetical protein